MKSLKSVYLLALAIGAGAALSGCEKVLDKKNLSSIGADLIYNDSTLANLNLNYVYENNVPAWFGQSGIGLGNVNPGTLSEELYAESVYLQGTVQLSDVTDFGTGLAPANNYGRIRFVNAFLRDVKNGSLPQRTKNRLRAQAQFWRAWRYFDLVRVHGGVPLVFTPLNAVGDDARAKTYLPRNTTTECLKAIVADLDSAITYLPGKWPASSDWGRITKGSAAAFKARVLLYAASPQFTTDNTDKWQAAFVASQQAQSILTTNGYGLHASYDQLWFQEVNNPEAVLITGFNTSSGDQLKKNNQYDNATRPAYTGTSGSSNLPTWNIVQAYPMLDGKKAGVSTKYPYNPQLFYKNRDPRFDKTIAYNGCTWPLNGNTSYRLWTYLDATGKSTEPTKATNTGFYCRKAINSTVGVSDAQYVGTDWIEIRYAEVLLNLAESACGVNNLALAYDQLRAVRKRAGIEIGDGNYGLQAGMNRDQMFEAILYERQIEFAFEGKRFWDLRRRGQVENALNGASKTRYALNVRLKPTGVPSTFAATRDNLPLDQIYTDYLLPVTSSTKLLDTKYVIDWKSNYNFFAIPQAAIDNNPSLQQNDKWGGSFDPLQ